MAGHSYESAEIFFNPAKDCFNLQFDSSFNDIKFATGVNFRLSKLQHQIYFTAAWITKGKPKYKPGN